MTENQLIAIAAKLATIPELRKLAQDIQSGNELAQMDLRLIMELIALTD